MPDIDRDPSGADDGLDRRDFLQRVAAGTLGALAVTRAAAQEPPAPPSFEVGMLVHDDMVLLDLVGPQTVLSLGMGRIHLVGSSLAPVRTDVGVSITPTVTYADCPADLDVLFVPGGLRGSVTLMQDAATLAFLADRGAHARYVTSVCTGALVLGAAGLLRGYRAATHWYVMDSLALLGATPVHQRVVSDRNRMTGGGVTAGIDFGLTLLAQLRDAEYARRVQLVIEYDPAPPFNAGSPKSAGQALTDDVLARRRPLIDAARNAAQAVAGRWSA